MYFISNCQTPLVIEKMNFTLFSSSSELACSSVEGLRTANAKLLMSKPFLRVSDCMKRRCAQASYRCAKKVLMSSHLVPRHLERSFLGKKQLEEPRRKLDFVRTLLIDNYDSYTYNIYQELSITNGVPPVVVRNDEWTWEEICHFLYEEGAFDNIVISPGPGSPTCPADIGICLQVLLECWDVPVLGVCLGHQALGYVHGAHIVHAAEAVHGRLSEIEHNGCRLFDDIPSGWNSGFRVVRYHSLVIDEESLPEQLIPIAWTLSDNILTGAYGCQAQQDNLDSISRRLKNENYWLSSHANGMQSRKVLMGVMHATRPHYGVQFHPESVATCHGKQIFENFREITKDYWLRMRSPRINNKRFRYAAPMQVPETGRLFREVPGNGQLVNSAGVRHYGEASASRPLEYDVAKNSFGILDMVNLKPGGDAYKFLKLRWRKFDNLASQVGGARNIFSELYGKNKAENTFWLDSSSTEKGRARFSFMGGKGGSLWKQVTFRLSDNSGEASKYGGHLFVEDAEGSISSTYMDEGFLDFLDKELLSFCYDEKDYAGLPFDFYGGFIGYIGYDLKVECGAVSNLHKSRTPDACFFFADNLVVIDHEFEDIYILSINEGNATKSTWLDDTEQKLVSLKASPTIKLDQNDSHAVKIPTCNAEFCFEKSKEQYIRDVENCLKYIKDGESYELCLTTQTRKNVGEIDSLGLYLHLREKNPAPYAAWLNFSKENLCICSSSPERFLRLDRNSVLEAKPIKGTVARGATLEEDQQLKLQLQYSEKDQAENLMIVDLLRNDLGRVCEPGSVYVPHLMDVESYATVHTMVSTIRGKKRSNVSAVDCVKAAFPGGSMTGAPKLRSMELLDSIESCSRGIYSGSIGFFSYNQTFDLNIVIRTVVIHEGEASIGAGGAIVALSNPEDEYEEMVLKTRAPTKAVMEFQ